MIFFQKREEFRTNADSLHLSIEKEVVLKKQMLQTRFSFFQELKINHFLVYQISYIKPKKPAHIT